MKAGRQQTSAKDSSSQPFIWSYTKLLHFTKKNSILLAGFVLFLFIQKDNPLFLDSSLKKNRQKESIDFSWTT